MEWKKMKGGGGLAGVLILLLGMVLLLSGCESDAVAPQDELPQTTEKEAAQQAALVAVAIAKAGPQILTYNGKKVLGVYPYTFPGDGDITGSVVLEYFIGGADGSHSHWDDADYGLLYTVDDPETDEVDGVSVALELPGGLVPIFVVTFSLQGPIDRAADTAEVFGSGNLRFGVSSHDFTIPETDPVVLTELSSYPSGGEFTYVVGSISLTAVYDGDDTVDVYVGEDEEPTYTIDLDTGTITLIE